MRIEVEQKFPVNDLTELEARLKAAGARFHSSQQQVDTYFAHPGRDFAKTDEALRIRRVGDENFVTYKGPKLDATTKSRREIELPIPSGDSGAAQFVELLTALGFLPVAEVRKQRRAFTIDCKGRQVEGALDQVEGVGSFVELELAVDESEIDAARECIRHAADSLGLEGSERRSYLELLLESRD